MAEANNPHISPGIPFEVDGEVIYLSPNSAEGKAVQRMKYVDDPDQWVTILDEDEEIDLDELDERLRQRGYNPTSVSDQKSQVD